MSEWPGRGHSWDTPNFSKALGYCSDVLMVNEKPEMLYTQKFTPPSTNSFLIKFHRDSEYICSNHITVHEHRDQEETAWWEIRGGPSGPIQPW